MPHKRAIEQHLVTRLGELFALDYDLLLYDVTSTYFEGQAAANPLAQRGYSRDHRPDCKQVCIALVVTREGLPLGYEVFAGNRTDVTTVEEIVGTMEARYGLAQRVWVMDRGMTSEENLTWLRGSGRRYLLGTPKSELRKWARALTDERAWTAVREGVEAKTCVGPEGADTFLLVRSVERREKERAMHTRFGQRIETGLTRLARRVSHARRPVERGRVERQIGRLLAQNPRAAGRYAIDVGTDPTAAAGIRVDWMARPEWDDWARWSEGCYVLRTNMPDWSPEELWRTYVQLIDAEAAFRIQKSDLALRPIWHQRADRVQAHILVCFLAYVLWKTLEQWQQQAGLGHSPRTILEELRTIQSTDVVLPTTDEREVRLRCVVRPNRAQTLLLDRLAWPCRTACGRLCRSRQPPSCSADFLRNRLKSLTLTSRTAEVGLDRFSREPHRRLSDASLKTHSPALLVAQTFAFLSLLVQSPRAWSSSRIFSAVFSSFTFPSTSNFSSALAIITSGRLSGNILRKTNI